MNKLNFNMNNSTNNKELFKISFPSIKILLAISTLLVLLRCCSVIDWPVWILFLPVYAPYVIVTVLVLLFYIIKYSALAIIYIIDFIIKAFNKIKYGIKKYFSDNVWLSMVYIFLNGVCFASTNNYIRYV